MYNNIGNTPLILSDYLSERYRCRVYIKEDFRNPGASSKDRIAWYMIHYAEKSGQIRPGGTIVEASSGNTAIGLAMLCRLKGYQCRIYLSKSGGEEKEAALKSLGAEVIRCKTSGGPEDPQSSQFLAAEYAKETSNAFIAINISMRQISRLISKLQARKFGNKQMEKFPTFWQELVQAER